METFLSLYADQLNLDAMQVGFNCFLTHNLELSKANTVSSEIKLGVWHGIVRLKG